MSAGFPTTLNVDGRPVWEPPVLDYSHLIDTEQGQAYTKQREAVLEFTGQDVARATAILDKHEESELLNDFIEWAKLNDSATDDSQAKAFWQGLRDNLRVELLHLLADDEGELGRGTGWVTFEANEEGPWKMEEPEEWEYYDSDFEGDYGKNSERAECGSSAVQVSISTSLPEATSSQALPLQVAASFDLHHLGLHRLRSGSSAQSALQILIPRHTPSETDLD